LRSICVISVPIFIGIDGQPSVAPASQIDASRKDAEAQRKKEAKKTLAFLASLREVFIGIDGQAPRRLIIVAQP